MPIARIAVPFGQAGSDAMVGALSTLMMALCGLAVGWRPHRGPAATVAALGLIVLFRYALSWVGVFLGLAVKDERKLESYGPLIFPFTMIGNTFVPTGNMPAWLRTLADWNPVSAVTAATRELFGNPGAAHQDPALPLRHPIGTTLLWCGLLIAVFLPLARLPQGRRLNDPIRPATVTGLWSIVY
jgi:ABC-2 type transport system permease protein